MIIDKGPLLDEPHEDAPPAYEAIDTHTFESLPDVKSSLPTSSASTSSTQTQPPTQTCQITPHRPSQKRRTGWFTLSANRTARDTRNTILALLRDIVRPQPSPSTKVKGILDSCAVACKAQDLSFSSIIQERYIEGHSPIYWTIVNWPGVMLGGTFDDDNEDAGADLLSLLLERATPLTKETVSDIRLACLATSDQRLFERLRLSSAFSPISGKDQMLLGEQDAKELPDTVKVEETQGNNGAFIADMEFKLFQKRMRVVGHVGVEFIARGRLWSLSFSVAPVRTPLADSAKLGSWIITLLLLEPSQPTWIDARLVISEPPPSPSLPRSPLPSSTPHTDTAVPEVESPLKSGRSGKRKPKPTISVRLKSAGRLAPEGTQGMADRIVVPLEDSMMCSGLQYTGCSYICGDGSLKTRLEARLAQPEAECVIC